MSVYDWLLFLHVLAAFALVASTAIFTALFVSTDPAALRLTTLARRLWDIGGAGTLVFGVWLALNRPEYQLWDGWVIAALVLWAVAAGTGTRFGAELGEALVGGRRPDRSAPLYAVMTLAVALLLADMIFKPGA